MWSCRLAGLGGPLSGWDDHKIVLSQQWDFLCWLDVIFTLNRAPWVAILVIWNEPCDVHYFLCIFICPWCCRINFWVLSKPTSFDTTPPKLVKAVTNEIAQSISSLVNMSLFLSCFPHELKKSETSLYKGQNNLEPQNYRPLTVLTCLSNFFERVYNDEMYAYFKDILYTLISAFRKWYGCHHVLTKLMENSKQARHEGKHVELILSGLSKAFDFCHTGYSCVNWMHMVFQMKHVAL